MCKGDSRATIVVFPTLIIGSMFASCICEESIQSSLSPARAADPAILGPGYEFELRTKALDLSDPAGIKPGAT